ncbi:hypothetical protein LOK49_LG08G00121 [Camellia lanceoleosa]|uniref:Uncharacterized protein n=1 Tax=Camellia lanceoleosa TaxID=1840588 RepID=A0ACC0GTR3_9ERIC|nr:hypothetical protein LOK49_LG08G00121 [Camellia lanceoleosa]
MITCFPNIMLKMGILLHLVARQPSESQPPSTSSGETSADNGNRGHNANAAGPRNRIGQISQSVVLGTLNVGEQGEGIVPDLTRVIGAVLNSIGIGSQTATGVMGGVQPIVQFNSPGQAPQGNETEGARNNTSGQSQAGNQTQPGQALLSQNLPQPIPDSLHTLSEFMNRVELALQNGHQPNQPLTNIGDLPTVELPSNARGLSTPETLSIVLRNAQRLLSGPTVAALSAESYVNSGPAVYISSSGPNPIMVQPFPLQSSLLFGGSAAGPSNPGTFGPIALSCSKTSVGPRASNAEGAQGERVNRTGPGDSGQTQPPPDSVPLSTVIAEVNSQIRNFVENMQSETSLHQANQRVQLIRIHVSDLVMVSMKGTVSLEIWLTMELERYILNATNLGNDNPERATAVPLGLGLGDDAHGFSSSWWWVRNPQSIPALRPNPQPQYNERRLSKDEKANDQNSQVDLQQVGQRIEHRNQPREIFRSIVESAAHASGAEDLVDELCSDEGLTSVSILSCCAISLPATVFSSKTIVSRVSLVRTMQSVVIFVTTATAASNNVVKS